MRPKDEHILAVGMFSLLLSIIFEYIDLQYLNFSVSDFLGGLFTGVSIVLNLFYLIDVRPTLGKNSK